MSLALGTLGLAMVPPGTANAQGRTPLRVTADDVAVARRTFNDLLVQSNHLVQRP